MPPPETIWMDGSRHPVQLKHDLPCEGWSVPSQGTSEPGSVARLLHPHLGHNDAGGSGNQPTNKESKDHMHPSVTARPSNVSTSMELDLDVLTFELDRRCWGKGDLRPRSELVVVMGVFLALSHGFGCSLVSHSNRGVGALRKEKTLNRVVDWRHRRRHYRVVDYVGRSNSGRTISLAVI